MTEGRARPKYVGGLGAAPRDSTTCTKSHQRVAPLFQLGRLFLACCHTPLLGFLHAVNRARLYVTRRALSWSATALSSCSCLLVEVFGARLRGQCSLGVRAGPGQLCAAHRGRCRRESAIPHLLPITEAADFRSLHCRVELSLGSTASSGWRWLLGFVATKTTQRSGVLRPDLLHGCAPSADTAHEAGRPKR